VTKTGRANPGENCSMKAYRRPFTGKSVLVIATHAFLCFVLFILIAIIFDDQAIAFLIILPAVFLSTIIVRRRLWGPIDSASQA